MADERYQWLDQEAAERLLRGEPVDALDDPARPEARRLAEALDSARTPSTARAGHAELPGEAAALAAFRRATAERAALAGTATPVGAGRAVDHAELGHVRLAPAPAATRRRWGRSVRYGLAAAVAAVTVGGVAVAAGTGVLPLMTPEPAATVTAAESPDPVVTGSHGVRKDPEVPSAGPDDVQQSPGSSPSPGVSTSPGSPSSSSSPSLTAPPATRHTPEPGRTTSRPGGDTGTGGSTVREKALKVCRDYRSGRLDAADRRKLTGTLRGGETLSRYCDRLLGSGGTGASADPREDGKTDDGSKDGSSKDDDKADGKADGTRDGKNDGGNDSGNDGGNDGAERRNRSSEDTDKSLRGTFPAAGVTLSGPSAQY
ncbi:hypothetical protein R1T08_28005 [Streptomyces sp. SBC-4]|nr:hypothetical protein [Streptomyces sp. SBC-4]MDV5147910.1 hypothetical protein [Streptomyces sp. SBC-4]